MRVIFLLLLLFFIFHTIRDILQIFDIKTPLATFLQTNHPWCRPYCDFVTFPLELFGIVGSLIVLKRKTVGLVGILVLLSLPLWSIGFVTEAWLFLFWCWLCFLLPVVFDEIDDCMNFINEDIDSRKENKKEDTNLRLDKSKEIAK